MPETESPCESALVEFAHYPHAEMVFSLVQKYIYQQGQREPEGGGGRGSCGTFVFIPQILEHASMFEFQRAYYFVKVLSSEKDPAEIRLIRKSSTWLQGPNLFISAVAAAAVCTRSK
jgi:hypothetical protein